MSTELLSESASDVSAGEVEADKQALVSPGQRLSNERVARNLSQKEVADKLHITIHYVNAIEHDAFEKLPGAVFAKGYIKSYAELLGLDVQDYLNCFEEFQAQLRSGVEEKENRKRRASGKRNLNIAFASVFLFVGLFVAVWYFNGAGDVQPATVASISEPTLTPAPSNASSEPISQADDQPEPQLEVASATEAELEVAPEGLESEPSVDEDGMSFPDTEEIDEASVAVVDAVDEPVEDESTPPLISAPVALIEQAVNPDESLRVITITEDGEDILRISFSGESWVEVNDGSANQVYRDLLEAGDVLQITGEAPFNILLGDAPFTQLTFNGDEIDVSDNIRIDNSARLTVGL